MGWAFLSNRLPAEQTDEGRDAGSFLSVGAGRAPMRSNFIRRNRRGEKSLPLEGKVVRLKPDRMRSKVAALYQLMVMIGSFDLISQP